ncbi:MAG TPA: hypothetical protein DIS88_13095 [Prevotella sp.]|nr:hypothetical protein [Prevotella sp.]
MSIMRRVRRDKMQKKYFFRLITLVYLVFCRFHDCFAAILQSYIKNQAIPNFPATIFGTLATFIIKQ